MSSDCSSVLFKLEDAIRSLINEHGFSEHCQLKIEQIDSQNDVLSSAYKVSVREQNEKMDFFVKCLQNERDNKFVEESRIFFQNEMVFYGELLVAFDELQRSKRNDQVLFKAAPKCYKSFSSPDLSYIIMENLQTQGYISLEDETQPLSLQQAQLVMEELGRLHALSFVMKDQQPLRFANITDKIQETLFADEMKPTFGRLFVHAIHDALKLARHSLPPGSIYVDRLSLFTLNVFEKMTQLATGEKDDEQYKVVTHGDVRKSNMLFRYENGESATEEPTGVCLLDYQACRYSSPVHDLSFFLLVSLDKQTRDKHRDQLIREYHRTLCTVIQDLGSDPLRLFPFAALRDQLVRHTRFALGLALVGLPLYMDEGPEWERKRAEQGTEQPDAAAVLHSAKEASARKSMRCKNKMMEVIMDVVDQGYL